MDSDLRNSKSLKRKGIIYVLFILGCIALPAVINLAYSSEGKELPLFQHFRHTGPKIS